MSKKNFEIRKQSILPGFEEGRFEPRRLYERGEFQSSFEDGMKRDNRVSIKISGRDLSVLNKAALDRGIPLQTLLSQIIHKYADGQLRQAASDSAQDEAASGATPSLPRDRRDVLHRRGD